MRKPERTKLVKGFRRLMSEIGATMTRDYTGTLCNSLEYKITTQEHGQLRVCLHHYNDSKMSHWVSGYLADFAEEFPNHWHGFSHRKQNFHCESERADIFLDYFRKHLERFGVTQALQLISKVA